MKLYDIRAFEFLDTTLLSYVDDGTIITQSRHLGVNMTVLKSAYGVIFDLFTRAGLALRTFEDGALSFLARSAMRRLQASTWGTRPSLALRL